MNSVLAPDSTDQIYPKQEACHAVGAMLQTRMQMRSDSEVARDRCDVSATEIVLSSKTSVETRNEYC